MNLQQLPIKYELVLDEVNLVIEALAELPFKRAEPMVTKLRSIALAALDAEQKRVMAAQAEQAVLEKAVAAIDAEDAASGMNG